MELPKCPKCKKTPYQIIEVAYNYLEWDIRNGKIYSGESSPGDIIYCVAFCSCGHEWRLRKLLHVRQIDEKFFSDPVTLW